ncbi:TolC family protein [Sulfurimonas sp. SAG-AH-194-C20]|nr:TolC family protein [Sulfurimonas sp. SAG-AH-194-C20]MDF1879426.1 TolC family protein [Sulfurimonas sp. SAG-AH-194-C20]
MIKLLLSLCLTLNLYGFESNSTMEIINLENDTLFHAKREVGLTLYDAINRAIKHSNQLDASYQVVVQDKQKVKEVKAGHLPVVNLSGDVGYELRQFALDENSDSVNTPITSASNYKKIDLYLTITENIWAGGSIENSVNEKDALLKASLYDYRDKLEALVVNVANGYFDVVYGEIALKIANKNMKNYEKILNIVSIKEKNGAATKGDVNFIRANVDNAKTDLIQRQKTLSDALAQYIYLLQTQTDDKLPFEISTTFYNQNLNKSLQNAQEFNAKILKQKAYIKATKYGFLATNGSFQPKVDFAINGETRNEYDIGLGKREKVNAIINFNYNLYNGNKDEATAIRLLSKMREQKYLYKDIQRKLTFEVKVLHRSVSTLSASLSLTQSEVIAARKVVKSYWIAFQHGTQDLQALQLAQRNLNRAEQDYAEYKKSLIVDSFALMQKTGTLLQNLVVPYRKNKNEFQADTLNLFSDFDALK